MKKIRYNRYIILFLLFGLVILAACSKMDDYKKYVTAGETSYTGKIDSVKVYSGHNRVLITGLFRADPKVSTLKIYWDSRADSVVVPVTRSANVDTLNLSVPVSEGPHSFELVTFDKLGNKSITVYSSGIAYGTRYESYLINKPVKSAELDASTNIVSVNWGGLDLTSGPVLTEVVYTNAEGQQKTVSSAIDSTITKLRGYKQGTVIKYRTLYLPDTLSVDTFKLAYLTITPAITYFKNMGNPFRYSSWDGSRWGVLADWNTNAQVKNTGNNTYGGYEKRGSNFVLSFEGGWGLRAVTNGKIYQSTNLPAGKYTLTCTGIYSGPVSADTRFFAVSVGNEMPDITDVKTRAIAYAPIGVFADSGPGGTAKIQFTLTETTRVTLGFVATMADTGSYFKVMGIDFLKE